MHESPRRIEAHRYQLTPRNAGRLGRFADGPRSGCLLRVHWEDLPTPGHADLHPWPELGDDPVEQQLAALRARTGRLSANAVRALYFARREAEACAAGGSMFTAFAGLSDELADELSDELADDAAIENHRFLGGLPVDVPCRLDDAVAQGFRCFKVKVGGHPAEREAEALRRLLGELPAASRLRLDFNGSFADADTFRRDWPVYERAVGGCLDWVEDPLAKFEARQWERLQAEFGIRFALDRGGELEFERAAAHALSGAVRVWVLKPAVQVERRLLEVLRSMPDTAAAPEICVTSYLDHPLGQLAALWVAASIRADRRARLGVCGLASQVAYEPTDFSAALRMDGACLRPPRGIGWGWADRLRALAWEPLR